MSTSTSQNFDSYLPIYDTVPEKWQDARPFLVEMLKKISIEVNRREIGWFLNEEIVTGQQFFPSTTSNPPQFRSIFRNVIDFSPLPAGTTSLPHGITVDANFTLVELFGSATNSVSLKGTPINQPNINYDSVNINITSALAYDRAYAIISYIQEI
jgi:hypothetical protein